MSPNIETLKMRLSPARYFELSLEGQIGKPTGQDWYHWNGLCPFHEDRRPGSFVVNKASGAFRCFSCGAKGGDIIAFHMLRQGKTFHETLAELRRIV